MTCPPGSSRRCQRAPAAKSCAACSSTPRPPKVSCSYCVLLSFFSVALPCVVERMNENAPRLLLLQALSSPQITPFTSDSPRVHHSTILLHTLPHTTRPYYYTLSPGSCWSFAATCPCVAAHKEPSSTVPAGVLPSSAAGVSTAMAPPSERRPSNAAASPLCICSSIDWSAAC